MKLHLKNIFLNVWYALFNEDYRFVKKSLCFDSDFYLKKYPDVAISEVDPLLHYLTVGFAEPRQPNALFDISYYLKQVPALQKTGHDPLIHFLHDGWRKGVKPNFLFDPLWYVQRNSGVDFTRENPLTHFLKQGGKGSTSLYFDAAYYSAAYNDVEASAEPPLAHYFLVGIQEKRRPSLYFDTAWYLDKTPVLLESEMDPLAHYFYFGIQDRKSPSPLFDPDYYVETYKIQEEGDLFAHYMKHGKPADHQPCSWFDPTFYRSHYLESNSIPIAPLDHYLAKGVHEGLYPNKAVADLPDKPIISLLVPVYNVTPAHLNNCIRSVLYQSYPHWELCLADDCSTREEVRPLLEQWASQDSRIKVTFLEKNLGISGATNVAAELVTGSYVGFLDNDDELTNDCLFRVVQQINSTKADLYYSDEDLIGDDGRQFNIFHKPDFNKELLLSHNYVTHFVVADKMLYENGGGFDSFLDGAQDFDLFLKLSEQAKKIVHIPQILYHWRASESSTSINHNQKQYANEAGRKAVANALDRRGVDAEVELLEWKFYYRVTRKLSFLPHISICILYREDDNFQQNLASLVSSTVYPDVEFLIIKEETQQLLLSDLLNSDLSKKVRLLSVSGNHTPAGLYNEAVDQSKGRYTVFLNSNVQLQQEKWIQALLEYVLNENVGMVGGRILPFKQNEFVTTVPNMENQSSFYYARYLQECSRHMNGLQWPQNVFAVSWNLAMVEKKYFLEMGGFNDESFGYLFADSDLCFRMQEQGREIFYTPFALGQYLIPEEEQFSSQLEQTGLEKKLFQNRWQDKLSLGDPYYNLNVLKRKNVTETDFLNWYVGEQAE